MATLIALPTPIQDKLRDLAKRLRQRRLWKGVGQALALVAGLLLVGLAADAYLGLSSWVRAVWLGLVAGSTGIALVRGVVWPWVQPLDEADLAALVEAHFPDLDERLLSSVELSRAESLASPALAQLLFEETAARTRHLSFAEAVQRRGLGLWWGGAALLLLLLLLVPSLLFPQAASRLWSRLLLPWREPAMVADFSLRVTPGDVSLARGRALAVQATLVPRDEWVRWPHQVTLVFTPQTGLPLRQAMLADDQAAPGANGSGANRTYSASFVVTRSGTYHIEADNSVSESFTLRAIEPVELLPESPQIVLTPPAYAQATLEPVTVGGLGDLTILRGSQLHFTFQFTRPALRATLLWTPLQGQSQTLPLEPAPDQQTMILRLTPDRPGKYQLLLEAEEGVCTPADEKTTLGGTITLQEDQPPRLASIKGAWNDRPIPRGERLCLEGQLRDDVAVAAAALEYRLESAEDKTTQSEAITLLGVGQREARFTHLFPLADKAKPGQTLAYRLRYQDNRPAEYGGPNVRYYPESGWWTLRLVESGPSPREEEIKAQRDSLAKQIDEIKAALRAETRGVDRLRVESRNEEQLQPEQRQRAAALQQQNRHIQQQLEALAREAQAQPELQPVAEAARELASSEMRQAGNELEKASAPQAGPEPREQAFKNAEKELQAAYDKLEALAKKNEQLAQDRLDQAKVEALAQQQKVLADEAEKHAAAKEAPPAQAEADRLRREQEKLARQLEALAQQSDLLKKSLEAAHTEKLRREAEQAAQLAQQQRDLNDALEEVQRQAAREKLAALADKQKELAQRVEKLARATEKALQADRAQPLPTQDAHDATQALKRGEAEKAAQAQDRAARDLDKLARDLQRLMNLANDPREAARQLARLQEELAQQHRQDPKPTPEKLADRAEEQQTIREAVKELSLPPKRKELANQRDKTLERLAQAENKLRKGDPEAQAELERGRDELRKLAAQLPPLSERQAEALRELEKLARSQDDLARRTDADKNANELAKKQADLAEKMAELDTPGQEARRDRLRKQMAQAAQALQQGQSDEARVAQKRAQQQLQRLREALSGQKPADEKAAELARQQRELAKRAAEAAARPDKLAAAQREALQQAQNKLSWQTETLPADEAPAAKKEAAKAVRKAAATANAQEPTSKEARQAMEEAARKLEALAQALGGSPATDQADKPEPAKRSPLAQQEKVQAARELAQEQRDLRDAVRQAMQGKTPPPDAAQEKSLAEKLEKLRQLAAEQDAIRRAASDLARQVGQEQGPQSAPAKQANQAAQAGDQASRDLAAGALPKAAQSGQTAEEALKGLAQSLQATPRSNEAAEKSNDAAAKSDTLEQSRRLAARQEKLNRELAPLAKDAAAARAQQQARQSDLEKQAGELAKRLQALGDQKGEDPQAGDLPRQAAQAARQAREAMKQAQELAQSGNGSAAQTARERAVAALQRAAQRSEQAGNNPAPQRAQAGQALEQARQQLADAKQQLGQGLTPPAANAMQQAGQWLRQAAEQLGRSLQPSSPRPESLPGAVLPGAAPEGGGVDGQTPPRLPVGFDPRRWGQLPGELRTKIVQEARAKFGDDYARMIKLYFEQLADSPRKR